MEEDHNHNPEVKSPAGDDLDTTLDHFLPVPANDESHEAARIEGPEDYLLPIPDDSDSGIDDASTKEELEVDSSSNDVDDIISLDGPITSSHDSDLAEDFLDDTEPIESVGTDSGGESIEHENLAEAFQPEIDSWDDDNNPLNHESVFFAPSSPGEPVEDKRQDTLGDGDESQPSAPLLSDPGVCPGCGAIVDDAAFCPACGTEQHPNSRLASMTMPLIAWTKPAIVRSIMMVAAVCILISLLADNGTMALILGATLLPVIIVTRISMEVRQQKRQHLVQILLLGFAGAMVGTFIAWLGARTVNNSWFDTGAMNYGAAGFGGTYADAVGAAPFAVWLLNGILLPAVTILVIAGFPYALRIATGIQPKESTGMLLSAATAAGYVFASASVFFRPLASETAPMLSTSEWTLTIIGLSIIRPLVWIFGGAMIGAVVWRFIKTADLGSVLIPGSIAIALPMLFTVFTLSAEPTGLWSETILGLLFAGGAWFLYRRFLSIALRNSREGSGNSE